MHKGPFRWYTKAFCGGRWYAAFPAGYCFPKDEDWISAQMEGLKREERNDVQERALVVIPTYNEADNVAALIQQVLVSA